MRNSRLVASLVGALSFGACMGAMRVSAQNAALVCGRAGRPWVSVAYSGEPWPAELRATITADLRAGLELQGIDVCALGTEGSERPLALIEMRAGAPDQVAVGIDVHDAVTEKRVLRDVDLRAVPADGHGLTLAVAAEELLRASWAELAINERLQAERKPPPEVQRVVEGSLGMRARFSLGARGAFEQAGGGQSWLGGDAVFAHFPGTLFGYELAVQVRRGLNENALRGRVESSALGASAAALFAPWHRDRATTVQFRFGVSALRASFDGVADAGAESASEDGLDVHLQLGVGLRQRLVRGLDLALDAGIGAPLRSVEVLDGSLRVTGTGGPQFATTFGLEARF